ncbi:hypothetical protein H2200_006983 [Cladophialophora chaetospira]|uniref:Uncharacterized protein n=1 Tax=Cladophialophora chaetospira TaxID=386627 RepID=A0AA38X985_9EURO|nr:hypothetical protein H2200_006983 [Cladophialophora chaetospira]
MLQDMIVCIRRDLQEQILSRRPRRAKLPDSTTGMSSVVLGVDRLLDSAARMTISESFDDHDDDMPTDYVDAASTSIGFEAIDNIMPVHSLKMESEYVDDSTTQQDTVTIGCVPTDYQAKKRFHEGRDEAEHFLANGGDDDDDGDDDDAGVILSKGRKSHIPIWSCSFLRQEDSSRLHIIVQRWQSSGFRVCGA